MKIILTGGPNTGKTTVAEVFRGKLEIYPTDDFKHRDWRTGIAWTVKRMDKGGDSWIVEGVQGAHVCKRWMQEYDGSPCDYFILLSFRPFVEPDDKQRVLGEQIQRLSQKIRPEMQDRGTQFVEIHTVEFLEGFLTALKERL